MIDIWHVWHLTDLVPLRKWLREVVFWGPLAQTVPTFPWLLATKTFVYTLREHLKWVPPVKSQHGNPEPRESRQSGRSLCALSLVHRRLEWAGQSSSWCLTWRIWGGDMTETWQIWRRPRGWSSSRAAETWWIPERPQVSLLPALLPCVGLLLCSVRHWPLTCFRRSGWQRQQDENVSAGMCFFFPEEQPTGGLYRPIPSNRLFWVFSPLSSLEQHPSEGQYIRHFQHSPGKGISSCVSSQHLKQTELEWASLSLQEKIKQEVMRRASRACSSGKPSVRSASQSSESSCSAAAKDDSCSVEDRWISGCTFVLCRGHSTSRSASHGFPSVVLCFSSSLNPGQWSQRKHHQKLPMVPFPLPSPTQSASQPNKWPPGRRYKTKCRPTTQSSAWSLLFFVFDDVNICLQLWFQLQRQVQVSMKIWAIRALVYVEILRISVC